MSHERFRIAFDGSSMKRPKLRAPERNTAVALRNAGTAGNRDVVTRALDDNEPLVRQLAAWALGRIASAKCITALRNRLAAESAGSVRGEIARALAPRQRESHGRGCALRDGISHAHHPLMRTITLEEHFVTPAFLNGPGRSLSQPGSPLGDRLAGIVSRLRDVGSGRIGEMDAAGIDVQVLSLNSPGVEQLNADESIALSRDTNDYLASAIAAHPDRFAGFATVPTAAPDHAVRELERAIRELGFKGVMINGHQQGRYLDDPRFEPILASAESLNVPIYIHPTQPPAPIVDAWYSGFSPALTYMFANAGWGWHIETAVHVLRMVLGGVFDRHPKLQVIVGHLGEGLPFMMSRVDVMSQQITKLERPVSAYLRENVHYTISGFNFTPTFLDLLMQVGVDRILFSADYPYASMSQAREFLEKLPVSAADRERIAHGNAVQLLHM